MDGFGLFKHEMNVIFLRVCAGAGEEGRPTSMAKIESALPTGFSFGQKADQASIPQGTAQLSEQAAPGLADCRQAYC